jgi:DNA-binding GntR family transcriptional regulator
MLSAKDKGLRSELQSELVGRIGEWIRSRDHERGERVREAVLSRELGVSRTPVRAALQHLVSAGVLKPHELGGYTVLQLPSVTLETMTRGENAAGLYGRMLRDIILNEMPDQATESALMRHYEVGRGEILKVLRRLVREGLAEPLPGRGWTMLKFDIEQMRKSYHLRTVVEPALLIDRDYTIDRPALERLRAEQQAALRALSPSSPWRELFEIDAAFHEMLARGSNNDLIVDIIRRQNRLRRLAELFSYSRLERIHASMMEHISIVDALLDGDQAWASALMRQHLVISRIETEEHFTRDLDAVRSASSGIERLT